jgi:threonine/homoserine/homoserine lactone efflux protein
LFGIHNFGLFFAAAVLLILTPGPDTLYIVGRSIAQGRPAGVASALGISCGTVVHTIAAALGLSAFLAASASAFMVIKLIGAGYLIYLGVRMFFTKSGTLRLPSRFGKSDAAAAFQQGMFTNILNPKVALFFLAFLPQFIDPASASKVPAFLFLGLTFVTAGTLWCLVLAWFAAAFSERLRANATVGSILNRLLGSLFVFLGVRLATAK